jgi:hypothetical protein
MPSSSTAHWGTPRNAFTALILAIPLLGASAAPSSAEMLSWIRFGTPYYDYDPYDRYHRFGRYYPYSRCHCAERLHHVTWQVRKHKTCAPCLKKKRRVVYILRVE